MTGNVEGFWCHLPLGTHRVCAVAVGFYTVAGTCLKSHFCRLSETSGREAASIQTQEPQARIGSGVRTPRGRLLVSGLGRGALACWEPSALRRYFVFVGDKRRGWRLSGIRFQVQPRSLCVWERTRGAIEPVCVLAESAGEDRPPSEAAGAPRGSLPWGLQLDPHSAPRPRSL